MYPKFMTRCFAPRSLLALALAAAAVPASAHPLAPNVDTYIGLVGFYTDCGISNVFDITNCASTLNAAFTTSITGIYGNTFNAQASLSPTTIRAELHSVPGPVKVRNSYIPGGDGNLLGAWFDDITVSGPTPTAQIGVSIHSTGAADRIPGGYSSARWHVAVGSRNPAPNPAYYVSGDFLSNGSLIVQDGGTLFSPLHGPSSVSVDQTSAGSFTANVGRPFELGYEFEIYGFQANIDFGDTFTVDFSVPAGYTLTSRRGLLVNVSPVPEPSSYALLVAGLLVIGAMAHRRLSRTGGPAKTAP